jgi:hypothetical protein
MDRRSFLALVGTTALAGCSGVVVSQPLVSAEIAEDIHMVLTGLGTVLGIAQRFVSADVYATMQSYYTQATDLVNSLLAATQQGDLVQMARRLYDVVTAFLGVTPISQGALATVTAAINILLPLIMSSLGVSAFAARRASSTQVAWARQVLRRR